MTIRHAVAGDTASLYRMEQEVFSAENFPLSRRAFYYHVRNNLLLVAESDDNELLGYILMLTRRKSSKLYSLCVPERFQCKGVGSTLLNAAVRELIHMGHTTVLLEVRSDNVKAIGFYRKFGFIHRRTLEKFYRDGCDAYLMEYQYAR